MERFLKKAEATKERILDAAVRYKGEIYTGASHGHAVGALKKALGGGYIQKELLIDPEWDGFVTSSGRFVNRKEAWLIARDARQFPSQTDISNKDGEKMLYSEKLRG